MKRLFHKLLRHYFAGLALHAILSGPKPSKYDGPPGETVGQWAARKSYVLADYMIEASENSVKQGGNHAETV